MSRSPYIQIAPIRLRPGIDEAMLLAASDRFETEFVRKQEGILRRQLLKAKHGGYADLVFFASKAAAEKIWEAETTSPHCAEYFAIMEAPDESLPDMGVLSFEHLKTYE